ncbi:MAG: DoxX family protein [Ignavibacteria bacterium]|nr:DoxX family protein [Ignavibacteria bacterium]
MKINFSERHSDLGLFIIRLGLGISFIFIHGLPKIKGGPELWLRLGKSMSNLGINFLPEFWGFMSAFSEFVIPVFIITGLFFRPALLLIAFTMFVAMLLHLTNMDPWLKVAYPMELLFVFAGLFLIGPGRFSLDHKFRKKTGSSDK